MNEECDRQELETPSEVRDCGVTRRPQLRSSLASCVEWLSAAVPLPFSVEKLSNPCLLQNILEKVHRVFW